jgi:FFD and TFG box motifs.
VLLKIVHFTVPVVLFYSFVTCLQSVSVHILPILLRVLYVFSRSQRTDWRTERKLNSETFGVASARRGGYRGRGYYGNRGMSGGMYRGGNYRGGYRGQTVRGGRTSNAAGSTGGAAGNSQQRAVSQQSKFMYTIFAQK